MRRPDARCWTLDEAPAGAVAPGDDPEPLTRWRKADLSAVYLELYPAKMIVEGDELEELLEEGRAFVTFLEETELLEEESEPADVLLGHLARIEPRFRANMADPKRFSFGKRLWTSARAEGIALDDREAMEASIARLNARPRAEREAVMGPSLVARQPVGGRFTPPGTPPRPPMAKRRKRRR